MDTIIHNMLQSTFMDTEIASNKGNVNTILSTIRNTLQRLNQNLVTSLYAAQQERLQTDTVHKDSDSDDNFDDDVVQEYAVSTSDSLENDGVVPISEHVCEGVESSLHEDNMEMMRVRGFECITEKWKVYSSTICEEKEIHCDLVLSEPQQSATFSYMKPSQNVTPISTEIYGKAITDFASFEKYVLKPNGYVVLFLQFMNSWNGLRRSEKLVFR